MLIELEGLYDVPDDWNDIVFSEFLKINELAEKAPKEDAPEKEKIDFYIEFISLFGIPKAELKGVKLTSSNDNELGIINLFNHLWQFTQLPESAKELDSFIIGKQLFMFNQDSLDLTGGFKPMASYTYEEYEEANGILNSMNKVSEGKLEHLPLLCAILFRPVKKNFLGMTFGKPQIEPYDETTVKDRAELFSNQLSMNKIFAAYFFLLSQIAGYNLDTADSLLKEVEKNLS